MFRLCCNKQEFASGIRAFNQGISTIPNHPVYAQSGKYKCWYAIKDENKKWIFGPSKFIGYAGIDIDTYIAKQRDLDGKATEKQLVKFSENVDEHMHAELLEQLIESLSRVNRTPGKSVKIKIIEMDMKASNMHVKYNSSEKCEFFETCDYGEEKPLISSFIVAGSIIKFDLRYAYNRYIVELSKETEENLFSGVAIRQGDNHQVECRAFIEFSEGSVEIHGLGWLEDNIQYRWSAYVEEADYV
ncbi:hypothetical protein ACN5L5_000386 [Cronobacter turicensis]|uniref:hypothetical protein n=1 Tax=Cronobacter turicensis TaxID=413502 RepID=UPI000518BD6E|nr:hypothetical protein [Cronobacter turicensis]MDI7416590.1 hypothetical protein [Cronobacter turicensis]MDI7496515.1 hypothetical protein [Cronobacter turicensis]